jgi:GTP-binding protein Era
MNGMDPESQAPADRGGHNRHRSGFVAIVGRPNVGKSTLLNRILGRKIAIVTPKPQTTRRRLMGIKTTQAVQMVFVDTPGIHRARGLMNERMVEEAKRSIGDADVVLWLVDGRMGLDPTDREIGVLLEPRKERLVVGLNKIDAGAKSSLLPVMNELSSLLPGAELVPLSALTGENVDVLLDAVAKLLPEGPSYYPEDELTDETERAIVAEIIREKVMLETRDEIPYAVAVTIDSFEEVKERNLVRIKATIHVERPSQKAIVIGQKGSRLKSIGQSARLDIEELVGTRVYLELFVRVQADWTKQVSRLREFGL